MKFLVSALLLCLILSCSQKENSKRVNEELSLDSLIKLNPQQLLPLTADGTFEGTLFAKTSQEIYLKEGRAVVSYDAAKYPKSTRKDLPQKWKTESGIYAGMPLDSLQAINGTPFYIDLNGKELWAYNWEGGKLANINKLELRFNIEKGGEPQRMMLSQDLIDKKWIVRVDLISLYTSNEFKPKEPCHGFNGDYPYLSYRLVTEDDMKGVDVFSFTTIRNEIFARHGYIFKREDLQESFKRYWWYQPQFENVDDKLNDIEKKNAELLLKMEENAFMKQPIVKLIKSLPLLSLPFDLEADFTPTIPLARDMQGPDGSTVFKDDETLSLQGLLPDTSKVYAVLWKAPGWPSVYGASTVWQVTTFTKKFRVIASVPVQKYKIHDEYGDDCKVTDKQVSTLNADWTYHCEYNADINCPDRNNEGQSINTTDQIIVSGQIDKATGRINEEKRYEFNGEKH